MKARIRKKRAEEFSVIALSIPLGISHAKVSYWQLEPRQRIAVMAKMLRDRLGVNPRTVRRVMLRELRQHSAR